ncbi:MAG TPA: HRDC domain-containing protein [Planctomycetota bacterium]|nr:HRDC domain-containing protein [Planctomycetota bacterium]
MSKLSSEIILAYEKAIARVILTTVIEATPALGKPPSRGFVAAVLAGSLRADVVSADGHRINTFGLLAAHGLDQIHRWIDDLLTSTHLERVQGRRALVCSTEGRRLAETGESLHYLILLEGAVPTEAFDLAVRSGLVEALRRFRAERAVAENHPEHRVFAEATLREVAARLPADERQLEEIPGLGEKRIAAFGGELLRIVAEHLPIIERLRAKTPQPGDIMDQALTPW